MIAVSFIIITGPTKADVNNLFPFTPYNTRGIFSASTVLFAYAGFDAVVTMAKVTKNPSRTHP